MTIALQASTCRRRSPWRVGQQSPEECPSLFLPIENVLFTWLHAYMILHAPIYTPKIKKNIAHRNIDSPMSWGFSSCPFLWELCFSYTCAKGTMTITWYGFVDKQYLWQDVTGWYSIYTYIQCIIVIVRYTHTYIYIYNNMSIYI